MADIATLGIKVTTQGVSDANRGLRDLERQGGRTEVATNRVSGAFGALKQAIATVGVAVAVREFVQAADSMALLNARLKLSTSSTLEFTTAQRELFTLSQQNSVGLAETIQLYTRLADPIRRVGGGLNEIVGITDTFQKALQLGGVTAAEAAAATLQFGQALGRGALSGDEFNSIAEASPRILKAIADGSGLPIEKLKELGAEGKLTSEVIGNALLKVRADVSQEFASLPDTVGKSMTRVKNDMLQAVADINNAGGLTAGLAEGIDAARDLIPGVKAELVDAASSVAEWMTYNRGEIEVIFDTALQLAAKTWELARATAEVAGTLAEWALQSGAVSTVFETLHVLAVNVEYVIKQIINEIGGMAAQAAALMRLDFSAFEAIGDMMKSDAEAARREVDSLTERILNARSSALSTKSAISQIFSDAKGGIAYETSVARLVFLQQEGAISAREFHKELRKLADGRGDAVETTFKRLRGKAQPTGGKKSKSPKEDLNLGFDTTAAKSYASALDGIFSAQVNAEKSTMDLNGAQAALYELMRSAEWARMPEPWQQVVIAETAAATAAIDMADAQKRLNDMLHDADLEQQRSDMLLLAQAYQAGTLGIVGSTEALEKYSEAVRRRLGIVDPMLNKTKDGFEELKQSIEGWGRDSAKAIVDFALTGKSSFTDMINSMLADLARMVVYQKITKPLSDQIAGMDWGSIATSFFGGGSTSPANVSRGGGFSPSMHSGGIVGTGEGSGMRYIHPAYFDGAARYHTGGIAGNEVPTILQRGEGVFTKGQMKALGAAASGGNVTVEINNYSGAPVKQSESTDSRGGRKVQIVIGDAVAGEMRRPGSSINAATRQTFGLTPVLAGR